MFVPPLAMPVSHSCNDHNDKKWKWTTDNKTMESDTMIQLFKWWKRNKASSDDGTDGNDGYMQMWKQSYTDGCGIECKDRTNAKEPL